LQVLSVEGFKLIAGQLNAFGMFVKLARTQHPKGFQKRTNLIAF